MRKNFNIYLVGVLKWKSFDFKTFDISTIEEILNDHTRFFNFDIPTGKEVNYILNLEKRITSDLKLLKKKEIIDKTTYKNIKTVGSRPGILYRLGKVLKETKNGLPSFCPILSAIGTLTYKLAKLLHPFLTILTENKYAVTDSFLLLMKFLNKTVIYIWIV